MADEPALGAVVVGTGFGCLTHVRALRAAGFEIAALVGRNPERTKERARRFDIPLATTTLGEALARPGVDAVAIATPPHTHAPLALEAIAAGKHVVCEKPFTRDADEARALLAAAEHAGVVHFLGTEFRWATGQALMTRVVARGEIGEPRLATFLLHLPLLADPGAEVPDWWADAEQGGGWLGAHASHVIDQILVTLGDIAGVSAALPHVADHAWSAEDSYSVRFTTSSGADGVLQASAGDWGPPLFATRIAGTKGTVWTEGDAVYVADPSGTRAVEVPSDLQPVTPDPPPADLMVTAYDLMHSTGIDLGPYTRLMEAFGARIRGTKVPDDPRPATFADGVKGMAVMDAIRRSAAERDWVAIG
jgi:predicted dehydrogenase